MLYEVTYNIFGKHRIKIEAEDTEEARNKADLIYQETDFGELTEILDDYVYSITGGGKTHYEI